VSALELTVATEDEATVAVATQSRATVIARRVLDVSIAILVLVALLPVLALVALAIRVESPGSVIFRQRRVGRGRGTFTLFKLRSMRSDADPASHRAYVQNLIASGQDAPKDESGQLYKLGNDTRVTRVGAFIRRWSLDELPQLLNVIRGEMSLVGPRPVIEYEVEAYPSWYHGRFAVKPGLTGLWQVSGRNERTYEEMVRLDLEYAERQTLFLDIKILARTAVCVLKRQGAA